MIFEFLKYLQPTHYFHKKRAQSGYIFPVTADLPAEIIEKLEPDTNFISHKATDYDIAWQAIQLGYIGKAKTYEDFIDVPIVDNYRFIKKYFHPAWVLYVLLIRIISFNNPVVEIGSWLKVKGVKRTSLNKHLVYDESEKGFKKIVHISPAISVIIPTLNRYDYLKDILKDLEKQDYKDFEVIVVDQSDDYNPKFYDNFDLKIKLVRQEEKALWLARNTAIKNSSANLIALSEDDVRIESDWLTNHLKCLQFFEADISAGVFYPEGGQIPKDRSFYAVASQFATGNAMLYKKIFVEVGLFDRQFERQRMGDGEFGMRAYMNGYKCISNPFANCIDVKADTGGLREMGSWDAFRPSNLMSPRPIPSVIYFFRRYFGTNLTKLSLLRTVPLSLFPYQYKKNKILLFIAGLLTIFMVPVIFYQVFRSWQLASIKLKKGPNIESLK